MMFLENHLILRDKARTMQTLTDYIPGDAL
jgi:hypothetical protein